MLKRWTVLLLTAALFFAGVQGSAMAATSVAMSPDDISAMSQGMAEEDCDGCADPCANDTDCDAMCATAVFVAMNVPQVAVPTFAGRRLSIPRQVARLGRVERPPAPPPRA